MAEFAPVLAGHLIGDWIVQTDWQAANKTRPLKIGPDVDAGPLVSPTWRKRTNRLRYRQSWKANQQHMLGYHLSLAACARLSLPWRRVAVLVVVSWLTHSLIDRRWPVRWLLRHTRSEAFAELPWGMLAADQALHLSILALTTAALGD